MSQARERERESKNDKEERQMCREVGVRLFLVFY